MTDSRGRVQIQENFRNDEYYGRVAAVMIFAALAAIALILIRHAGNPTPTALGIVVAEMAICGVLALWLGFDQFVWSGRYPYADRYVPWGTASSLPPQRFELARAALFARFDRMDPPPSSAQRQNVLRFLGIRPKPQPARFDLQVVHGGASERRIETLEDSASSIASYLRRIVPRPSRTIVLLGTSQTWGAGADTPDDTLHAQLHKRLLQMGRSDLLLVNASIRGSRSDELFDRYYKRVSAFKPELVIVNLSCNDLALAGPDFERNLTRLALFNRSEGAKTIFVLEPAQISLESTAKIMRRVAKRFAIPCLDLHGYLADPAQSVDSGYLWWDVIHLTSHGQRLAAEFIARGMSLTHKPLMPRAPGRH